jgi:8-oxo-dGTP pyrophosphatase MutT (NUDIX family)
MPDPLPSSLVALAAALAESPPDRRRWPRVRRRAAIAVVLRPAGEDLEVLLMRRQERPGDRWSGDVACPGGFCHRDEEPLATAVRETREELGVSLDPSWALGTLSLRPASPWHRLADFQVVPYVFAAPAGLGPLTLEPSEVASARWIPLAAFSDPAARSGFWWWWRFAGPLGLPVRVGRVWSDDYDVWGLTLRILDELTDRLPG